MRALRHAVTVSVSITLLAVMLTTSAQGEVNTTREEGARVDDGSVHLRGQLWCVDCTLTDVRALAPTAPRCLFELARGDQRVVIEVAPTCPSLPYHHVWWRGTDDAWATLTAQKHRFKEFDLSGRLQEYPPTSGLLDRARVRFMDDHIH
jgi:hypothetical protein